MTERTQLGTVPRDLLLETARRELANFERRESEFRKKDREERAAELKLPLDRQSPLTLRRRSHMTVT
jgi:hypothetical protein